MAFRIYRTVIDTASAWDIHRRVLKASIGWLSLSLLCAFAWPSGAQAQATVLLAAAQLPFQAAQTIPSGSRGRGEDLFTGRARFQNGGPPCMTCHSIASLPFPNGGTLGPNLTSAYRKLGSQGMPVAVKTLYFPVMTSIYDPHPLTLEERADLLAFFREAGTQPRPRWNTQIVTLVGFLGFCVLLVVTRFTWRDRLRSVRRKMVETATRQGGFSS
jgi:mono/diheme cytochrome c family protein